MHALYNIGIWLYWLGILVFSLINRKAQKWVDGRRNYFLKLPERPQKKKVVWFHCASLGEFDQGLPLMHKIKLEQKNVFLLVTFFSPSGFEHYHKRDHNADLVLYLPIDTSANANRFLRHFRPEEIYFVKYEFWVNYILEAKNFGAKIYNVSGVFRPNQYFFKWYGSYFRGILKKFDMFFVQNDASALLLHSIGIEKVMVTGDCRFDRVLENKMNVEGNQVIKSFKGDDELFVIGSSWPNDEKILFEWINSSKVKILLAPHDIGDKHLAFIDRNISRPVARYTVTDQEHVQSAEVLILDTIGQLSNAYSYGKIAYIGGGFSGSLHNILEPAVFGLPVIFGPKHARFPEAGEFISSGIGFSIKDKNSFVKAVEYIDENLEEIKTKTATFVEKNAGATDRILAHVTSS